MRIRLTPKASRDAVEGADRLADGTAVLKVRVRAVPEGGKANAALIDVLAAALGVARSRLALAAGAGARLKTVTVAGNGGVAERLAALSGGAVRTGGRGT